MFVLVEAEGITAQGMAAWLRVQGLGLARLLSFARFGAGGGGGEPETT